MLKITYTSSVYSCNDSLQTPPPSPVDKVHATPTPWSNPGSAIADDTDNHAHNGYDAADVDQRRRNFVKSRLSVLDLYNAFFT